VFVTDGVIEARVAGACSASRASSACSPAAVSSMPWRRASGSSRRSSSRASRATTSPCSCCGRPATACPRAAVETLPPGSLEPPVAHTARLPASEIVTNSVRHGGSGEDDWIGFEVMLTPSVLRVEVSDRGSGFAPAPHRPSPDDAGGRGLFLVDALADRWAAPRAARAYGSRSTARPPAAPPDAGREPWRVAIWALHFLK
jgi:hypothetical protein